jgi:hypothetical protein
MDPPGSTRWVVIPTALKGRRHELPLTVFRVARDVIEDTIWLSQGLDAVRSETLDRLHNDLNYLPDPDLISVTFLADLKSSLHHRHYSLRPWSYPKWEDEPESSTDSSSSSDDSPSVPNTGRQDRNKTIPETDDRQISSNQESDSASQSSEPSFYSVQESNSLDESGDNEDSYNSASTRSSNTLQTAGQGIPRSIASSDSNVSHRHYKFLVATWKYLGLQLELLKLLFAPRKHQNAKKAQEKPSGLAQPQPARLETSQADKQARTQSPDCEPNTHQDRKQSAQPQIQPLSELGNGSQVQDTPDKQQSRSESEGDSLFGDISGQE